MKEKKLQLSFDEVYISHDIYYNKSLKQIIGPYKTVVMARGIIGKWKQPIVYAYDTPMSKKYYFRYNNKIIY